MDRRERHRIVRLGLINHDNISVRCEGQRIIICVNIAIRNCRASARTPAGERREIRPAARDREGEIEDRPMKERRTTPDPRYVRHFRLSFPLRFLIYDREQGYANNTAEERVSIMLAGSVDSFEACSPRGND